MIEILVTIVIVGFAGYVIFKSLRNSSKGKCNCGCDGCKAKKVCSDKNDNAR
ncbi:MULTISPECIES: type II secretion system protein [unclassified Clostridium]|uniref:FeoB-associated Cys-rich membrane protein n=1 Tax=unclassified Clostridium TaxID=2614128 RepID=UPI0002976A5E|nr:MULTISPECIES: type II secretion system protein [unclassified Clostridium]EKQ54440.1 MAG: hypothetical protein A370_03264 [Clostridium sp. Maddingley MBC34-26]